MKVFLIANGLSTDITNIVTSITWSGSDSEAARKVSLNIASSPTDPMLPKVNIQNGNMISLIENDTIFSGFVFNKNKSYSSTDYEVIAYDGLIYLLKSKASYNVNRLSPENLTLKICQDAGVETGQLPLTGILITKLYDNKSLYEIISDAYGIAGIQNGLKYKVIFTNNKLEVIVFGSKSTQLEMLYDASFSESIDGMINKVKIYDSNFNSISEVGNNDLIKLYGTISEAYTVQQDVNSNLAATNLLQGPEQSASITAPGNIDCVTGNKVAIKDSFTGLTGTFWIASDSHTWADGFHTMTLELSFKEVI